MIPGEVIIKNDFIEINTYAGDEEKKVISVINKGDRAVQVGSHFHFFEINRCMKFMDIDLIFLQEQQYVLSLMRLRKLNWLKFLEIKE